MRNKVKWNVLILILLMVISAWKASENEKPVIYLIGDSTVKNGSGKGSDGLWGWGNFIPDYFDTTKIFIENHAIGGRNTRTFRFHGRWEKILEKVKPGDYVLIQFGHNDGAPVVSRGYGTIKGNGPDTVVVERDTISRIIDTVHTYGWYLRQYIKETEQKGATPIILSLVPRNIWKDGKVLRANTSYGKWAKEAAEEEGALFIDLNEIIAQKYELLGPEKVKEYFPKDHTHTDKEGAIINAESVVQGIKMIKKCKLNKFLSDTGKSL